MSLWSLAYDALSKLRPRGYPEAWDQLPPLRVDDDGWLEGDGVQLIPAHNSWSYRKLSTPTGDPRAIVAHSSETDIGSAIRMANNRTKPFRPRKPEHTNADAGKLFDRAASWHISIEPARIVQMISVERGAWHAPSLIAGVGPANRTATGIEMIGHAKGTWADDHVAQAARVWRALVQSYGISRAHAMHFHSVLDPKRRSDPGRDFQRNHAPRILAYAFA